MIEFDYYLLFDNSTQWFSAVIKTPKYEESNFHRPIDLDSKLIETEFLANLFNRKEIFNNRQYGNNTWRGWAISEYEYDRVLKLKELLPSVKEFNRLGSLS